MDHTSVSTDYQNTLYRHFLSQNAAIAAGTVSGIPLNLKVLGVGDGLTVRPIYFLICITQSSFFLSGSSDSVPRVYFLRCKQFIPPTSVNISHKQGKYVLVVVHWLQSSGIPIIRCSDPIP